MAILNYPTFLQPSAAGDIVGFSVQVGTAAVPARCISFGQGFERGKVPKGASIVAKIGSQTARAQIDVKTRYPGGSARFAVITVETPAMAANTVAKGMLSVSAAAQAKHLPVLTLLKKYNAVVALSGLASINVGEKLMAAIRAKKYDYWLRGPLATQARLDVPIASSLRLVVDVTCYADGTFLTDVMLRNDASMQPVGGTMSYNATITQAGAAVFASSPLNHFQYEEWRRVFHSATGAPVDDTHNVQHDIAYLIRHGFLQNYDLTTGIDDVSVANPFTTNVPPLSNPGWTEAMGQGGGRDDIGLVPASYARWIKCQDIRAQKAALVMANGAGSIPWHHYDPTTGDYVDILKYPKLWVGNGGRGPDLTQPVRDGRWSVDTAHPPAVGYVPYLLTGQRFFLDQINAQAGRQILSLWPQARDEIPSIGPGIAMLSTNAFEIRAQVWTFRSIVEAAAMNPDGGAAKTYWLKLYDNNIANLLTKIIPSWNSRAGEVAGYIFGTYTPNVIPPWQENYAMSVIAMAVGLNPRNNASPLTIAKWMAGFNLGLVTELGWAAGREYVIQINEGERDKERFYTTWNEMRAVNPTDDSLPTDGGLWVPQLLNNLATMHNLGIAGALELYKAILAKQVPGTRIEDNRTRYPHFNVVPIGATP